MNKSKELYSSPLTKTFVIRFEGGILEGSLIYGNSGGQTVDYSNDDIDDLGSF